MPDYYFSFKQFNLEIQRLLLIIIITIKRHNHSGQKSDLPWISEFLKTGQTEQSWREVIGCWTIAGWLTGGLSERLFGWRELRGEAGTSFAPQGREVTGLTIPDRRAQRGGRESRGEPWLLPVLVSVFRSLLLFHSPSPPRLPGISLKGSLMDLRVQGVVKVQHLKNQRKTGPHCQNHSSTNSAVIYLWWRWSGNIRAACIMTWTARKCNSESRNWISQHCFFTILSRC